MDRIVTSQRTALYWAILRIIFLLDKAGEEDLPRATAEGEVSRELKLMAYQIHERISGCNGGHPQFLDGPKLDKI